MARGGKDRARGRFILFAWKGGAPSGGMSDVYNTYSTYKGALSSFNAILKASAEYHLTTYWSGQILDTETGDVYDMLHERVYEPKIKENSE
jgi:hypothetical protein